MEKTVICAHCNKEVPIWNTKELFTGRKRYICMACASQGEKETEAHHAEWLSTKKGKDCIELARKCK